MPGTCAACGTAALTPHLQLADRAGAAGLGDRIASARRPGPMRGEIARCPHCGHMQLDPLPDVEALALEPRGAVSAALGGSEAAQRAGARLALERIEAHQRRRGSLLDLGCRTGLLLAEAREHGWRTVGVEPSAPASRLARERLGLAVITGAPIGAPLPEQAFDAIAMTGVIERLTDPGAALERIRPLGAPGAVLWLSLPDAGSRVARTLGRWWWSVRPGNVQYFTRRSIATLLNAHGFQVLEISTQPAARPARIAGRTWAPDLRDRMAVIARSVR